MSSYYNSSAEYPPLGSDDPPRDDGEYAEEQQEQQLYTKPYHSEEQEAFPPLGADDDDRPSHNNSTAATLGDEEPPCYDADAQDSAPLSYADAVGDDAEQTYANPDAEPSYEQQLHRPTYPPAAADADADVDAALDAAGDDICAAAAQLWELDTNRLSPGDDYTVSTARAPRRRRRYDDGDDDRYDEEDEAEGNDLGPFITEISPSVWERDTYALLKALLDNYTAETGVPERVSSEERAEEEAFVSAVCATPAMRFARRWLAAHAAGDDVRAFCEDAGDDGEAFRAAVHDLWFGLYGRDGRRDSSGFEHVFCGEIDDGRVKGLHNFVQVAVEEERGNLRFGGCLGRRGSGDDEVDGCSQVATIRFDWLGHTKSASSMFVGVSPEFEVALYTMWWLGGGGGGEIELGPYTVRVKMHELRGKLGAAYPEVCFIDYDELDSTW